MRILFLAQRVPYPPDRGDKITTFHQIRHLAKRHEVAVACLADGPEDMDNIRGLDGLASSVDAVPVSRRRARLRALFALATGGPLTVAYFNERELHRRVAARMEATPFDAIVAYSSGVAQFVEKYTGVPRIMQFADLDSLKWRQYVQRSRRPMRWVYALETRRLLRYERHLATTFSHSTVCTPREMRDFQELIPGAPVSCVSNGVDLEYFRPQEVAKEENSLVFTGVMDYFPNVSGVIWFCREVLPRIREQIPGVTFTICGARPEPCVQELGSLSGVRVTGRVPDVRPYLAKASACVVPLHIARGIQNKLLEGMAMGLPAVATTVAFEGVEAKRDRDLLVADDADDFARAVIRLLSDEELRVRTGAAARACVEANYQWETQLGRFDNVLASVTGSARVLGASSSKVSADSNAGHVEREPSCCDRTRGQVLVAGPDRE
jgi:sugar transferase (PEP-CTERM/EpsH1 system associated)